jgi:hypothetical protein
MILRAIVVMPAANLLDAMPYGSMGNRPAVGKIGGNGGQTPGGMGTRVGKIGTTERAV